MKEVKTLLGNKTDEIELASLIHDRCDVLRVSAEQFKVTKKRSGIYLIERRNQK